MTRFTVLLGGGVVVLVLAVAGCKSKSAATPENFKAGLTRYLSSTKIDCLFPAERRFPYESTDAAEQKQLDALVKMQLLTVKREQQIARYETTEYGAGLAPQFCYGYRQVTSVDGFTPLKVQDGFNRTTVSYHYSMTDVPVWAKSDEVKAAFPAEARAISGNAAAQMVLAQTPVGWEVPN